MTVRIARTMTTIMPGEIWLGCRPLMVAVVEVVVDCAPEIACAVGDVDSVCRGTREMRVVIDDLMARDLEKYMRSRSS
jgi:hypothetical protein